jgi:putative flippase GtrA
VSAESTAGRVSATGTVVRYVAVGMLSLLVDAGTLWLL